MDLLSVLLTLLIIGVVVYFAFWMVDSAGIPSPMNWIIKAIVLLIGLIWLFQGNAGSFPRLL